MVPTSPKSSTELMMHGLETDETESIADLPEIRDQSYGARAIALEAKKDAVMSGTDVEEYKNLIEEYEGLISDAKSIYKDDIEADVAGMPESPNDLTPRAPAPSVETLEESLKALRANFNDLDGMPDEPPEDVTSTPRM